MTYFEHLEKIPAPLSASVEIQWQSYIEADGEFDSFPAEVQQSFFKVWACSEFVMHNCARNPGLIRELVESGDLQAAYDQEQFNKKITIDLQANDEAGLSRHLRVFRRREMLRIIWRDIAGWASLAETTRDLSNLAEACIDFALSVLHQWQCSQLGVPVNDTGDVQQLVVLGMGKLGAWELNVSSDIDLIFTYPEDGEVKDGPRSLSNSEFFTLLGRKFIQSLDQQTADGFVFRVDMRLRPFGEGGPLVTSFNGVENYYQVHGRSWERYAMVKARVVAGDRQQGEYLMSMLRPFVYRRYLDYGAYESLRELKSMIAQQVKRKGMANNVKLGAGGIREIEFIAQVFQLIRGGREKELQERRVIPVLDMLQQKSILPGYVVIELKVAYEFLRNTEHRIQAYQDRQLHEYVNKGDACLRLALGMGFDDCEDFLAELNKHRERVQAHFEQVFVAPQTDNVEAMREGSPGDVGKQEIEQLEALWYSKLDDDDAVALLNEYGFREPASAYKQLQTLHKSRQYISLSRQGQTRLDRLIPLLIGALQQVDEVDVTFERIMSLLTHIARRSVYLALLLENPMVLSQLIKLCYASPWVARYIQQSPILLDDLMDPRSLYLPPGKEEMEQELRHRLERIEPDDVEQGMDILRHFKQTNLLRVAAADISNALPLMKVSDHLSWIAEIILDESLEQAWHHLVNRHGRPVCQLSEGGEKLACDKGFAVIGYGKLGGYELGYGSDLDMVFIHGSENNNLETLADESKGQKSLAIPVFFARLGQRIIHLLTSHTSAGVLYEADMRLRPNGASGLLVTSLKSFRDYQLKKAWLWEHQALVRARVVAGDPAIADAFNQIREEVLAQPRDLEKLREEVIEMRNRMRKELSKGKTGQFELKQGYGGIVDIEFMVQYGVLAWSSKTPALMRYTDNIRVLEQLAKAGYMTREDAEILIDAYRTFRARLHKMALQERSALVDADEYKDLSAAVMQIWQNWLVSPES